MRKVRLVVWSTLYGGLGISVLWAGADFWPLVRTGLALILFGKAAFGLFQLVGDAQGEPRAASTKRGLQAMAFAYVAAGCLVAAAALWQRTFFSLLIAYAAFSFAWAWFWVQRFMAERHAGTDSPRRE